MMTTSEARAKAAEFVMYALYDKNWKLLGGVRWSSKSCREEIFRDTGKTWRYFYNRGYRVRKVRIVPVN